MTDVPCRKAAAAAAVLVALVALVAGGAFQRWAIVGGAVAGAALFVGLACLRQRWRR